MADAEGPSIAVHGSTLGLAYQVSGEWATGGQYMSTQDGGQTWSESFPISPNATEDHFMPMLAFDDDGNPFVAVKFGDDPMVVEGVMRSTDGGQTFQPAQPASADVGSGLACECCPSKTIFGHGRYYSVYRQNDENLRDMRLVSSEDGATWDHQLDLDPTDWMISACPETGASLAWLPDGRLVSTFRSSGNGASEVYVNVSDVASPMSSEVGATVPVTNFIEAGNQDQPHIACGPTHTVAVWQENSGGWEIHVASSANDALPGGLSNSGEPISTSLSGSNLHPEVAIHGSKVHVIWKNSGSGQVMYLRGTLEGAGLVESGANLARLCVASAQIKCALKGPCLGANFGVLSSAGAVLHRGTCDSQGAAVLPTQSRSITSHHGPNPIQHGPGLVAAGCGHTLNPARTRGRQAGLGLGRGWLSGYFRVARKRPTQDNALFKTPCGHEGTTLDEVCWSHVGARGIFCLDSVQSRLLGDVRFAHVHAGGESSCCCVRLKKSDGTWSWKAMCCTTPSSTCTVLGSAFVLKNLPSRRTKSPRSSSPPRPSHFTTSQDAC